MNFRTLIIQQSSWYRLLYVGQCVEYVKAVYQAKLGKISRYEKECVDMTPVDLQSRPESVSTTSPSGQQTQENLEFQRNRLAEKMGKTPNSTLTHPLFVANPDWTKRILLPTTTPSVSSLKTDYYWVLMLNLPVPTIDGSTLGVKTAVFDLEATVNFWVDIYKEMFPEFNVILEILNGSMKLLPGTEGRHKVGAFWAQVSDGAADEPLISAVLKAPPKSSIVANASGVEHIALGACFKEKADNWSRSEFNYSPVIVGLLVNRGIGFHNFPAWYRPRLSNEKLGLSFILIKEVGRRTASQTYRWDGNKYWI